MMASPMDIEDNTTLSTADYNQIQLALHLHQEGVIHAGISVLAQMARRLYVCRCWHIDKIKLILQPILDTFEDAEVQTYLRHPDEETDVLFLT